MRNCPVCTSDQIHSGFWGRSILLRCGRCRLVYLEQVPDLATLKDIYSEKYFIGGQSDYVDYPAEREALQANFRRRLRILRRMNPGPRLYEVGCAYGFFLEEAAETWEVSGSDISTHSVKYATNELGLQVTAGSIETLDLPAAHFDVVVLWDTIEHLYDPALALRKLSDALRPGGLIALTTGDIGGLLPRVQRLNWRLLQPNHLFYFSQPSISFLLDNTGFDLVHFSYEGVSRSFREMSKVLVWRGDAGLWRLRLYDWAQRLPIMSLRVPLNTFDIMFVLGRKR